MIGAPAVLYVLAVALLPMARGIADSLYDDSLLRPGRTHFVGLDNYVAIVTDPSARRALVNTVAFTVAAVAIELALGLALALLLWRDDRFNRACLALLVVPMAVTPLAVGLIFRALLAPDFGLIGYTLARLHLGSQHGVLADPLTALPTLVAIDAWQWTPLMVLILLAGLRALPADLLEAATVDGAGPWALLRRVVLPLLAPTIALAVVLRAIDAFKLFDTVFVTTQGGPGDATNVLMFYAAKQGLEFFEIGAASAVSTVMLACVAVMSAVFVLLVRRADARAPG